MKLSIFSAVLLIGGSQLVFAAPTKTTTSTTTTTRTYIPQFSPTFPSMPAATGVVSSYNFGPYNLTSALSTHTLSGYPTPWESPDPNHPEVQAMIKMIDWSKVPNAPVRKATATGFAPSSDEPKDSNCWWSYDQCTTPKIDIPEDIYECPTKGDWGLSYDDGPFNRYTGKYASQENPFAEPHLYNFLAENNNQKANLFYIGSNVATYPAAAQRGFNDGHYICVHTWSHPTMTTMTNHQAVAELYWTLKVIKQTTGVTPKFWRPPQGDVDDRIRSIAWQMGMRTVLWDWDSNDWNIRTMDQGTITAKTVNGYFEGWVKDGKSGKDTKGHIVLEHELNSETVKMSEKWLPTIQKVFNVIPALACNNVSQPYWEPQFVYPLVNTPVNGTASNVTTINATTTNTTTTDTVGASTTSINIIATTIDATTATTTDATATTTDATATTTDATAATTDATAATTDATAATTDATTTTSDPATTTNIDLSALSA